MPQTGVKSSLTIGRQREQCNVCGRPMGLPFGHGKPVPRFDGYSNLLWNRINDRMRRIVDKPDSLNAREWIELAQDVKNLNEHERLSLARTQAQARDIALFTASAASTLASDGLKLDVLARLLNYVATLFSGKALYEEIKEAK